MTKSVVNITIFNIITLLANSLENKNLGRFILGSYFRTLFSFWTKFGQKFRTLP